MNRKNVCHKFLITCFVIILTYNNSIFAQGPNAPEAAAFEPVDATDMVNLVTGDFTYVLPVLNVPSPEGGYPLSLSYHAGVGMDQEASWVGLGWSLNPGAISRGVNGYPDDWKNGTLYEGFFDVGGSETNHRISTSYTSIAGGWTVSNSFSYNSSKGFGGSVGFGYGSATVEVGISQGGKFYGGVGAGGVSIGINPGGRLSGSIGGSLGNGVSGKISFGGGGVGISAGYDGLEAGFDSNGVTSLSYGSEKMNTSVGISFSSRSISLSGSMQGAEFGQSMSLINSISSGDYTVETDESGFAMFVPTPIGVFSIGYNKQKVKWYLNSQKNSQISGALYLGDAIKYECKVKIRYTAPGLATFYETSTSFVDRPQDCNCSNSDFSYGSGLTGWAGTCVQTTLVTPDGNGGKYFMDVNEIGFTSGSKKLNTNNAMFPSYDSYSVMAQGLSGSIIPKVSKTGALLGLSRNHEDSNLYSAKYNLPGNSFQNSYGSDVRVDYVFKNQYSSSFTVNPSSFVNNLSAENIYDYHEFGTGNQTAQRKRDGRVVSYYTIRDIVDGIATQEGLLLPKDMDNIFTRADEYAGAEFTVSLEPFLDVSRDAIGGYMINTSDGKTYHYSQPVFNLHTSTRTIGVIDNKPERKSYFETNQKGYATHWLLTAITGPDYIKKTTARNYPDVGDYGYWVRFDYGKWSNTDVWKKPYNEEYNVSEENPNIKSKTLGRKQLYYLDRIKTRTHTALFVKNTRLDDRSIEWERHEFFSPFIGVSSNGEAQPSSAIFDNVKWTIPSQNPLRLERIILVKNKDDLVDKSSGNALAVSGMAFPPLLNEPEEPDYNLHNNLIDVYDDISETLNKAIKVIDFGTHYSYSLVNNTPNSTSGRLTLNGVSFKGKGGVQIMPSYKFRYLNNRSFNYGKMDLWGFHEDDPKVWSLNKITTPVGASIDVQYESDDYNLAAAETGRMFERHLKFTFLDLDLSSINDHIYVDIKIEVDDQDPGTTGFLFSDYFDIDNTFLMDMWLSVIDNQYDEFYNGALTTVDISQQQASIISINESDNYMIVRVMAHYKSQVIQNYNPLLHAQPLSYYTGANQFYAENQKRPRPIIAEGVSPNRGYSLVHQIMSNKRPNGKIGGGLRVKELSITGDGSNYKTHYSYNTPESHEDASNSNYISSGVISYQPFPKNSTETIAYGSELPAPTPMYEYVTVKNNYNSSTGDFSDKSMYRFKVLEEKDVNDIKFGNLFEISKELVLDTYNTSQNKEVNIEKVEIKDNFSSLGKLLEIKRFNNKNHMLSKTINNYASLDEISQGIIQEAFESYKEVDYEGNIGDQWFINSSKRTIYPSVLKSTTTIQGSYNSTTYFDEHDYITGMLLETRTEDSKGNKFKTKVVPAYTIPEYSTSVGYSGYSMSPKLTNYSTYDYRNKNMLTQVAANYTFIDDNGDWKPISVGINTWSNLWTYPNFFLGSYNNSGVSNIKRIWRRHKTYIWNGDIDERGIYQGFLGDYDDFIWSIDAEQTNPKWKNISTITQYDHYSMPLEIKDINGNYSAMKMCDDESKVLFNVNSKLIESTNIGGEYPESILVNLFEQEYLDMPRSTDFAHTGDYSVIVNSNDSHNFVRGILVGEHHRSGKYKMSFWVLKGQNDEYLNTRFVQESIGGLQQFNGEKVFAGDWVQLNHYFNRTETETLDTDEFKVVSASGTIYVDDFRIHPIESSMTSYVYNEWDELSYILNSNNLGTHFKYDEAGRLEETYNEIIDDEENNITGGFKRASKNYYRYKNQ